MKAIILILAATVLAASRAYANLDDPGQQKITVKSEIERGESLVDHYFEREGTNPKAIDDYCRQQSFVNQQKNTDSEGFELGVKVRLVTRLLQIANDHDLSSEIRIKAQDLAEWERQPERGQCNMLIKIVDNPLAEDELSRVFSRDETDRLLDKK